MRDIEENTVTLLVIVRAAKQPVTSQEIAEFAGTPLPLVLKILMEEQHNAFVETAERRVCTVSHLKCKTWRITPVGEASLQLYLDSVRV
jgi:hypothetical protein